MPPLFPDVMLDLETTGTDQARNAIIQIAAVKFNLAERTIDMNTFDRCLTQDSAPGRYWDEGCRVNFWGKRVPTLNSIWTRGEDAKTVLADLRDWVNGESLTMWGKPTHFDHSFLSSYYHQFGMQIPFHFRMANDMNTFIRARYFPEAPPQWEKLLDFQGDAHNALFDVFHQIKVLFKVADDTKTERVPDVIID